MYKNRKKWFETKLFQRMRGLLELINGAPKTKLITTSSAMYPVL